MTWDRHLSSEEKDVIESVRLYVKQHHDFLNTKNTETGDRFQTLKLAGYRNRGELFLSAANLTAQTDGFVEDTNIFIRGLGGEVLRGMFFRGGDLNNKNRESDISYAVRMYKTRRLLKPSAQFMSFVDKSYIDFFRRINFNSAGLYNYNFGDLIYLEQRMSMWAASLLNEGDPAVKNMAGINSRKLFEGAYGLPPEVRLRRDLLLDIARQFNKELAEIPIV